MKIVTHLKSGRLIVGSLDTRGTSFLGVMSKLKQVARENDGMLCFTNEAGQTVVLSWDRVEYVETEDV